jgi:hypothetical protein
VVVAAARERRRRSSSGRALQPIAAAGTLWIRVPIGGDRGEERGVRVMKSEGD